MTAAPARAYDGDTSTILMTASAAGYSTPRRSAVKTQSPRHDPLLPTLVRRGHLTVGGTGAHVRRPTPTGNRRDHFLQCCEPGSGGKCGWNKHGPPARRDDGGPTQA